MMGKNKEQSASAGAAKSEHCFSKDPVNNYRPKNFIGKLSKRGATEAPQSFDKDTVYPYCGKGFKLKLTVCGHLKSCVEMKLSSSDKKNRLNKDPPIKVMTDEGGAEITDCMVEIDDSMCFLVRKPGGQIILVIKFLIVNAKTLSIIDNILSVEDTHYSVITVSAKSEKGIKQHKDRSDCGNTSNVQESNPVTGRRLD